MYTYQKASKPTSFGQDYSFTVREFKEATFIETYEWCVERFGNPNERMNGRWDSSGGYFFFRDVEDAFQFRLRWC